MSGLEENPPARHVSDAIAEFQASTKRRITPLHAVVRDAAGLCVANPSKRGIIDLLVYLIHFYPGMPFIHIAYM